MSAVAIRAALEKAAAAASPTLHSVYLNDPVYMPTNDDPYQLVDVVFAQPDNRETGPAFVEVGFCQIRLAYPRGEGWGDAFAQAQAVRSAFMRGTTLIEGSTQVFIHRTPEIAAPLIDGARLIVPVTIYFRSQALG